MDSKRGMEGTVPMGEVVDARSGMPERMATPRESGEALAGGEVEVVDGAGPERLMPAAMPPAMEGETEALGGQEQLQGDLVNITTRDGERIEKEWVRKTDELMDKTEDNPRMRLASFDEYRRIYRDKRYNGVIGGEK